MRKPERRRTLLVFWENFQRGSNIFLQIAMTIYKNKNAEEIRPNSKMIFKNKTRKNHEKAGNYNLQKPFELLLLFFLLIQLQSTLFFYLELFTVLEEVINNEQKRSVVKFFILLNKICWQHVAVFSGFFFTGVSDIFKV